MSSLLLYSHNMKQLRNKTKGLTRSVTKEGWMIFLTSVCTCSECRIRKPFQSSYKWCSAKICFLPERPVLVKLNKWRICKHTLLWQKKLKKKILLHVSCLLKAFKLYPSLCHSRITSEQAIVKAQMLPSLWHWQNHTCPGLCVHRGNLTPTQLLTSVKAEGSHTSWLPQIIEETA